jgi:hypothetical protein
MLTRCTLLSTLSERRCIPVNQKALIEFWPVKGHLEHNYVTPQIMTNIEFHKTSSSAQDRTICAQNRALCIEHLETIQKQLCIVSALIAAVIADYNCRSSVSSKYTLKASRSEGYARGPMSVPRSQLQVSQALG